MAAGPLLQTSDLPERIQSGGATAALIARGRERRLSLRELEREYILEILRETAGNKLRAAEILGVDRKTLYRKLDEYRAEDPALEI
jgi:DNA-binding NtrC family response regulator